MCPSPNLPIIVLLSVQFSAQFSIQSSIQSSIQYPVSSIQCPVSSVQLDNKKEGGRGESEKLRKINFKNKNKICYNKTGSYVTQKIPLRQS